MSKFKSHKPASRQPSCADDLCENLCHLRLLTASETGALKRQFFVSAPQLIICMIFTRVLCLFHSFFIPFCGGFRIAFPFKQFRQMIVASNVAGFTCKDFFKQLLRLGVIACFYVFES
jgi:hypothetical protein